MILKDREIILRAIEEQDAPLYHTLINDPQMEEMVVGWSFPVSMAQQLEWIRNQHKDPRNQRYTVELDGTAVGMASLTGIDHKNGVCELNIKLADSAKGKGVGTRVIKLLLSYCFHQLNMNCVTAEILDYNIPSQKLFEKCGMKQEGTLRQRVYKNGSYHSLFVYSILKSEF